MARLKPIYVIGNHDIDLLGLVGLPIDLDLVRLLRRELLFTRDGKTIRIWHGHQFDKFNDPGKALVLGRIAAIATGQVEMWLGTNVGAESTEGWLEKCARHWVACAARLYRWTLGRTQGERVDAGKSVEELRGSLDGHRADHPNEYLIAGHTHEAGWYEDWYVNVGSWQGKEAHYAKIDRNTRITLHRWPGAELNTGQLWELS